ncbi:MAG: ribosome silencing factor [Actinomycetota bacterium]
MNAPISQHPPADPVVAALAEQQAPWSVVGAAAADSKLGTATLILDVGDAISVTDHFVVTNGSNSRQVKAIVDEVEHQIKLVGGPSPIRVEGLESLDWVLVDYGEFVVHVFSEEARGYYQLERLWKDCGQIDWRAQVPDDLKARVGLGEVSDEAEAEPEPTQAGGLAAVSDDSGESAAAVEDSDLEAELDPVVERATW